VAILIHFHPAFFRVFFRVEIVQPLVYNNYAICRGCTLERKGYGDKEESGMKKSTTSCQITARHCSLPGTYSYEIFRILFCLILMGTVQCCFLSSVVFAEVYQWKDGNGNMVYGDSPPSGTDTRMKHLRTDRIERPEIRDVIPQEQHAATPPQLRDIRDISAILYMTDWCPYCKKARDFLVSKGVRLTIYNIDKDKGKGAEMKNKSGSNSIPVIDIEGSIIRGYVPAAISSVIEKKRRQIR
jgi:glutaredoxin